MSEIILVKRYSKEGNILEEIKYASSMLEEATEMANYLRKQYKDSRVYLGKMHLVVGELVLE
jgi:hypothetical protein